MDFTDGREWLDEDFKTSKSAVTLCLRDLGQGEDLPAGSILQIQSITNVSIPIKSHSESKCDYDPKNHILKFSLTDGKETAIGILYEHHLKLNTETPPGTKIKATRPIPLSSSRILKFGRGNVEVLGGYVEKLVENWRIQKEHDKKSVWGKLITNPGDDGPPKFKSLNAHGPSIALGNVQELRNAKAMDILEEVKAKSDQNQGKSESKSEFDVHRQEAISDLMKQNSNKKSFSKQFPQPEARLPAATSFSRNENRDRGRDFHNHESRDQQKPREPRFSSRKAKQEEEELESQYSYPRGNLLNLNDHFADFFKQSNRPIGIKDTTHHQDPYYQTGPGVKSMTQNFGRMGVDSSQTNYPNSQTFYRGGGSGQRDRFDSDTGSTYSSRPPRRGSRGGIGRGRSSGRGRGGSYSESFGQVPQKSYATYTPDPSSFPSLG